LELSTNSEHVLAINSSHYVQLEQPEVVIEAIRKLLK
jgi:pimeloyl-ACP methyl ester carboxylesterase